METDPSTYSLNAWQFEQALAILQREQKANTPSPRQEKTFKFLNIAIYGFVIAFLLMVVYLIFGLDSDGHTRSKTFDVLFAIDSIAFVISVAGITILFFLSLSYVRRLLRQRKLARQLGLWEALDTPWKTERRQNKLRNVSDLGILTLGFIMVVGSLFMVPMIAMRFPVVGLFAVLFYFVVGGAIIVTVNVRRSKERLGLIARLYSSLEGYKDKVKQDKDSHIHIPAEAYEKIAQIERAQIARDRVQSIRGDLGKAGASPYVVHMLRNPAPPATKRCQD